MIVSDIWEELKETVGSCDPLIIYRALTRAVELLATEGAFDPLIGTVDFFVDNAYWIALPRDVKTPLRLNINNNPAFSRNRIFEFSPNTEGSVDGAEVGWQWHERGYSPIQDEVKLPSKLRYNVSADNDIGRALTITGTDPSGRRRKETIIGAMTDHIPSKYAYGEVLSVVREATEDEGYLLAETGTIARYYADEIQPEYRVIKLSKTGVAVRMVYRKHVFKIESQDDIIPLHSPMAVIRAVEAVRLMQKQKFADAQPVLASAISMIGKEQDTRDEGTALSNSLEVQTVTNTNINTNDVLIVADIYDRASDILGGVGREKIFDRITDAVEALQNKTQWDSVTGNADVCRSANMQSSVDRNGRSSYGYFVLPRYVDAVLALNSGGEPSVPRNRWFEFHLNGPGSRHWTGCQSWEDVGDVCVINGFPRPGGKVIPVNVIAIPENALDDGKSVMIYGIERTLSGREIEVWRNGVKGWACPCHTTGDTLPVDAPDFVRIDRISRAKTVGFVRFVGFTREKTTVALVGDMGDNNSNVLAVASLITNSNPDKVVLLGDVNYEDQSVVSGVLGTIVTSVDNNFVISCDVGHGGEGIVPRVGDSISHDDFTTTYTIASVVQKPIDSGFDVPSYQITTVQTGVAYGEGSLMKIHHIVVTSWDDTVEENLTNQYGAFKVAGKLEAVPGNHDWGEPFTQDGRRDSFSAYFGYTARNFVRSFGDADVFFLDTDPRNPDGQSIGGAQHQWLATAVAASTAVWKVVVGHHPPYTSGTGHGPATALRWDFAAMGVQVVISAHEHGYERYEVGGVVYLVVGTGGKSLFRFTGSPSTNSLKRLSEYGALFMEVSARSLKFSFLNTAGAVHDTRELDGNNVLHDEILLGYWYPDEVEPTYRLIRVPHCNHGKVRIRYRKRTHRISSLTDVLNLRSRLAVENMLRAIEKFETDPAGAAANEQVAIGYLEEEQTARNPHGGGTLQFEPGMAPGDFYSIQ